jgi:phospholipase C
VGDADRRFCRNLVLRVAEVAEQEPNALDHVVVVMFENRSFDHLLGRLYQPDEVKSFEGVIGKDLKNPIPSGLSTERTASSSPTA